MTDLILRKAVFLIAQPSSRTRWQTGCAVSAVKQKHFYLLPHPSQPRWMLENLVEMF